MSPTWHERGGCEEWHCCDRNPRRSGCLPPKVALLQSCSAYNHTDNEDDNKDNNYEEDLGRGFAEGEPGWRLEEGLAPCDAVCDQEQLVFVLLDVLVLLQKHCHK